MADKCLLCGNTPVEYHHFPLTRRFGIATVPLCRECHDKAHWGKPETVERLIKLAPGYWRSIGEWELHREAYETWVSRRRYVTTHGR